MNKILPLALAFVLRLAVAAAVWFLLLAPATQDPDLYGPDEMARPPASTWVLVDPVGDGPIRPVRQGVQP